MGIRETQFIGLSPEAEEFLEKNCNYVPTQFCPRCHEPVTFGRQMKDWKDATSSGMFDDGPMLQEYTLQDGSIVREEIEAAPWDCGPMIYLKLIDKDGKDLFVWGPERADYCDDSQEIEDPGPDLRED